MNVSFMWRKVAFAVWKNPSEPAIYGTVRVDAEKILDFVSKARGKGYKITPLHITGKAVANALARHPEINITTRLGKIVRRKSVDIFFQVEFGKGQLSGVKIQNADRKSVFEIATELRERAEKIKSMTDTSVKMMKLFGKLPYPALRYILKALRFLSLELGVKVLPLDPDPFGSAMVTNIATFDLEEGFAPLFPLSKTPIVVTVGKIRKMPWVEGDEVKAKPVLTLGVTLDHRYFDGYQAGVLYKTFKEELSKIVGTE